MIFFQKPMFKLFLLMILASLSIEFSLNYSQGNNPPMVGTHQFGDQNKGLSHTCRDFDYYTDLHVRNDELFLKMQAIREEFSYGKESMDKYMETYDQSHVRDIRYKALWRMSAQIILAILTSIVLLLITCYLIKRGIKRGLHRCKKRKLEKEAKARGETVTPQKSNLRQKIMGNKWRKLINTSRCRCILYTVSILIAIVLVIQMHNWKSIVHLAVDGLKKTDCMLSYTFAGIRGGFINAAPGYTIGRGYLGINGYISFFKTIKNEVHKYGTFDQGLDLLKTATDELKVKNTLYEGQFKQRWVISATTQGSSLRSNVISDINYSRYNPDFRKEILEMSQLTDDFIELERGIKRIYDLGSFKAKEGYDKIIEYLSELRDSIDETREHTFSFWDYYRFGPMVRTFAETTFYTMFSGIILYFVFYTLSYKVRAMVKFSVSCQACFSISILTLSVLVEFMTIVTYVVSGVGMNMCSYAYQMVKTEEIAKTFVPRNLKSITKSCFYESGYGNLLNNLEAEERQLATDTLHILSRANIDLESLTIIKGGSKDNVFRKSNNYLWQTLDKLKKYEKSDFDKRYGAKDRGVAKHDPKHAIKILNELVACNNDEFQLREALCSKEPSVNSHLNTHRNTDAEPYCMIISTLSYEVLGARYASPTSCVKGQIKTDVEIIFARLKKGVTQHDELLTDLMKYFEDNFVPGSSVAAEQALQKLPFYKEQMLIRGYNGMQYFEDIDYEKIKDCRQIKQFFQNSVGAACFDMMDNIYAQGRWMLWMGPLMAIFGCLNFCTVMGTRMKLVEANLYSMGAVKHLSMGGPNLDKKNVDDVKEGWGGKTKQLNAFRQQSSKQGMNYREKDGFDSFNVDPEKNDYISKKTEKRGNNSKTDKIKKKKTGNIEGFSELPPLPI